MIITRGLKLSLFHIIFGSTTFQTISWTIVKSEIIIKLVYIVKSACTKEKIEGKTTAIIDQIFGIKFKTNVTKAQKAAYFNQKESIIT